MLFYDVEAFKYYWCIVVVDDENETRHVFEDVQSLRDYYKVNRHQTWVGYNSRQYDVPMLKFIMLGLDPYECSNDLIVRGKKWFEFGFNVTQAYKRIPLKNFDCSLLNKGLKKLEAFRGSSIIETSVPFDIDRPLTREEKDEVIAYCTHDVLETRKVFYDTKEEYDAHESLISTFELDPSHFNKSKAQLAALILGANKVPRYDEWEFEIANTIRLDKPEYQDILNWYLNPENHDYSKKNTVDVAGVPHVFAWGGIHGARPRYSGEGFFVNMDVASYYPAMMIEYGFLSRNVPDPKVFRKMRDDRLVFKKNKDPRQHPYKIVINGTFGAQKDKFNNLYDPRQANSICVSGQLLLLDLIEKLEDHCMIIQSNTDGVLVKLHNEKDFEKIVSIGQEWSNRTRMELEYETVRKVFQKDVNNYLTVDENGKYKSKGAYVKKLSTIDYDLPIVNEAIVQRLVNDIPIEDTINNCNELIKFQKIVMVSSKYKHALHGFYNKKLKEFIGTPEVLNEKHLRVFASTNRDEGGIFKVHKEKGTVNQVGDTPMNAFIISTDITKAVAGDFTLDRQYYIDMAKKRIKNFISE